MVFGGLLDELKISFFFSSFFAAVFTHIMLAPSNAFPTVCEVLIWLTDRFHNAHGAKLEDSVRLKLVRNVVFTVVKKASAEEM